ncbi:MAG: PD-(D/E)XK nuclease family protein, partial [Candidatus Rokuibacteriota bacterium]
MRIERAGSTRDLVEAVARLPAAGPLPCRTVLVPRERVAHSLRRELVRAGHAGALAGTRFVPVGAAAAAVLGAAAVEFTAGEEVLRPARLLALFRENLRLEHFPRALLEERPGWDDAFARAIGDLEAAGLRPDALQAEGSKRLRDVATIWQGADRLARGSWTAQRILHEAAALLERRRDLWPYAGPALAMATGHESGAQARFLRALPGVTIGLLAARPLRERHLERVATLYGPRARHALAEVEPRPAGSELSILAAYLFEAPRILADAGRPRSAGPDDTVRLEEHSGIDAEVEAAADWVAEQVADGVALEDIAVLVPAVDPVGGLVAERLARLPWRDGTLPVHVAGGLPLVGTAAGARALAVVRALR